MIHHQVIAFTENARHILIRTRVEAHAVGENARATGFFHGFFGIVAQVLRVAHVDVGGFTISDDEQQFLCGFLVKETIWWWIMWNGCRRNCRCCMRG